MWYLREWRDGLSMWRNDVNHFYHHVLRGDGWRLNIPIVLPGDWDKGWIHAFIVLIERLITIAFVIIILFIKMW